MEETPSNKDSPSPQPESEATATDTNESTATNKEENGASESVEDLKEDTSPSKTGKKKKRKGKNKDSMVKQDNVEPGDKSSTEPENENLEKSNEEEESKPTSNTSEENCSKTDIGEIEEDSEDEGIEELGKPEDLDGQARNSLYERAVQFESEGKRKKALKYFLQCLTGLKDTAGFTFLPQCLRKVGDIYFQQEEFEKAIQFIQAEKMFYETALIDTSQLEKKLELAKQSKKEEEGGSGSTDEAAPNPDALRADEYEKLARLCLEKQQPKLALEYQGKATKLRQAVFGDDHSITVNSLDYFTVIYAEVGKQQYTESLGRMEGDVDPPSPTSILRRRKATQQADEGEGSPGKKKVHFHDPPVNSERTFIASPASSLESREHEEWVSRTLLWILFFLCVICLAGISSFLYCRLEPDSDTCVSLKNDAYQWSMKAKYYYYYYMVPSSGNKFA